MGPKRRELVNDLPFISSDRLQLAGHGHDAGERKLLAERADLLDAFDEIAPSIEIAGEPAEGDGRYHRCDAASRSTPADVVERFFSWISRNRRLWKDPEATLASPRVGGSAFDRKCEAHPLKVSVLNYRDSIKNSGVS
jgi:hypothetical protein